MTSRNFNGFRSNFDRNLAQQKQWRPFLDSMKNNAGKQVTSRNFNGFRSNFDRNEFQVKPIMNKHLREIALNSAELNVLRNIASLCPYYDGIAVYDARSILMEYHVSFAEIDCETTPFIAPTPKGIYILQIINGKEIESFKMIKE